MSPPPSPSPPNYNGKAKRMVQEPLWMRNCSRLMLVLHVSICGTTDHPIAIILTYIHGFHIIFVFFCLVHEREREVDGLIFIWNRMFNYMVCYVAIRIWMWTLCSVLHMDNMAQRELKAEREAYKKHAVWCMVWNVDYSAECTPNTCFSILLFAALSLAGSMLYAIKVFYWTNCVCHWHRLHRELTSINILCVYSNGFLYLPSPSSPLLPTPLYLPPPALRIL